MIGSFITNLAGPTISNYLTPALEGAATGALTGAMTGQNIGKQALVGGITGGALGAFGGQDGALANYLGLTGPQANALIGGVVGGLGNMAMGINPIVGALAGALGGYGYGSAGYGASDPYEAGGASKASTATAPNTTQGTTTENGWTDSTAQTAAGGGGGALGAETAKTLAGKGGLNSTALALGALAALGSAMSKPRQGTWTTPGAANNPNVGPTWNYSLTPGSTGRTTMNPVPAGASYWTYGGPERTYFGNNSLRAFGFAEGGHNGEFMTRGHGKSVRGPGDGTSDSIPARLADGEYVLTAQEVSLLGQGSNSAGARKLDKFREELKRRAGVPSHLPPHLDGALRHLEPHGA